MPPTAPVKRLASTGAEGQEPETRSLTQLEGWEETETPPYSRCAVMLATETALKPYFLTGF